MAIPEAQLQTWSHQGAVAGSRDTYAVIRRALLDSDAPYAGKSFEVFLQGSYGNDTNIYAESDVDTVIRLDSIFRSDVSDLPPDQQAAYDRAFASATYTFDEFRRGVIAQLTDVFGSGAVVPGNKAIKIKPGHGRRSADVVVCQQYRRYIRFNGMLDQRYIPGIVFPTGSSGEIINYPKPHSENCTSKHQATNSWFKPTVRILKNMRSRLVADGRIAPDTAPSYYVEGLVYNVPNSKFGGDYQDTVMNTVNWLLEADRSKLMCANEQYWLLGNSNVQWTAYNCNRFLDAVVELWQNW